jgi:chromatin remodeling complex protein RSC6
LFDVGLKGNEEKMLVNSYAIFSGLKFKTTSYNHEGSPFYLVITIYQGSINDAKESKLFKLSEILEMQKKAEQENPQQNSEENEEGEDEEEEPSDESENENSGDKKKRKPKQKRPPLVLITKISPPLYINSRKLAKESSTKKYHTVIEPFDLQAVE